MISVLWTFDAINTLWYKNQATTRWQSTIHAGETNRAASMMRFSTQFFAMAIYDSCGPLIYCVVALLRVPAYEVNLSHTMDTVLCFNS